MRIAVLALLAGSLCLSACDDIDENIVFPFSRVGTYTLVTADGQTLPAVVFEDDDPPLTIEVLSGQIVLNSDNTFTDQVTLRTTEGGIPSTITANCAGTYVVNGNTLTFSEVDDGALCGEVFTGTLSGRTLTATIRDFVGVFQR